MHLLPCHRPTGPLERAPRTSLRADSAHGQWEGFWSLDDDGHYSRCVRADGSEEWFRIADDASREHAQEPRVIPLRARLTRDARPAAAISQMLLAPASDSRGLILVGTLRPRARAAREVAR